MPEIEASGRSSTRNAARFAVYEATIIMANPAHTIPSTRALKLRGVPSPMPLLRRTPQANHMALDRFRASSSVSSLLANLKRPKGLNLSSRYRTSATTWTDNPTRIHNVLPNGCKKDPRLESFVVYNGRETNNQQATWEIKELNEKSCKWK